MNVGCRYRKQPVAFEPYRSIRLLQNEMPLRILVVDDEVSLRETLAYNLEREGYVVDTAVNGEKAIISARRSHPDLIILDVMLPGMDGFDVCRELRRDMTVPILMLSARDEEFDRVIGLEIGADDYISKPFSMRELIARVKAHFRTIQLVQGELQPVDRQSTSEGSATFGNLIILYQRREVLVGGKLIILKPKEYDLLVLFSENKGRVFTRETIVKNVWGWDFVGESRTVDVHVRWLREKIEVDPYHPVRIVTIHGVGYRFDG
jgi:DNA-binding response OmpR family regulator